MTKPHSTAGDNQGLCESCNSPESTREMQTMYPLKMADGNGGWVQGTMWLCPSCLKEHRERDAKTKEDSSMNAQHGIRLGVAVLIFDADRLLLGRRGKEPNYGKWIIPGGGVKLGESWVVTGEREMLEETGFNVRLTSRTPQVLEIISETEHRVILYVRGSVIGGFKRAGGDLLEVRYFTREELAKDEHGLSPAVRPALVASGWL